MEDIISKAQDELKNNSEWKKRYAGYLKDIWQNRNKAKRGFNKPEGLSLYSTVGTRKENCYFLRFKGQNVGKITVNKDSIKLNSLVTESKSHDIKGCPLLKEDKGVDWDSNEASKFRSFFKNASLDLKTKSPEHFVENSLLNEFRKRDSKNKIVKNIQPVLLHSLFFQMPTPLKASAHNPEYSAQNGGGIDILSRITTKDGHHRVCVMEVKDENKKEESQKDAMTQAIIYATFISQLLDNEPEWFEFFAGHNKKRDRISPSWDTKDIEVVTIMPEGVSETFDNFSLEVPGSEFILHCRSLYYNKEKFDKEHIFEFSGSFLSEIKQ